MNLFGSEYRDLSVFLTGHTGFKGSWLALWLSQLGARVTGYALDPSTSPNHWDLLGLNIADVRGDVRDAATVVEAMRVARPEVVFHLAAQPLVRRSYREPTETWSTNVMGTVSVLEACRQVDSIRAIVVVTTDKCYRNQEWAWGYREIDPLGGHDPYSASKAGTELVAGSYQSSFFNKDEGPLLATARAGNVIGGGDWSDDRLIPDLVRAVAAGGTLEIRSPQSTRPWQHVLDSLSGYLRLGQMLLTEGRRYAEAWNFGPEAGDNRSVADVLAALEAEFPDLSWSKSTAPQPREANLLSLDISKARAELGWRPVWALDRAVSATARWYRGYFESNAVVSLSQIDEYVDAARAASAPWAIA